MTTELGTWLRAQREERGWSRSHMARQLVTAARDGGDDSMPAVDTLRKNIYRWENDEVDISDRYRLLYCRVLAVKPAHFGPQQAPEPTPGVTVIQPTAVLPTEPGVSGDYLIAYRGIEMPEYRQSTVRQEVLMAAHEGSDHAEQAERRDFGDSTLEQLHADVARLSAELMTGDPFALFLEMRRVRERIYRLLDGHMRPPDQAGLYFLLGCLSDLMAVPAADLGYPQAAEELLRAGWAYATVIDHRPLMAHLRLQLAGVVWESRPRQGRDLAADGLRYLADGPNAAFLHVRYARAAARLGDADGARQAIAQAHEAREREHSDDVLAIGGEFGLSAASQHYFAGSALVQIEGAEREAAEEIADAVTMYEAGPAAGEQHAFGVKALASIDLAGIWLRSGALDAAATTLEPVLSLVPAQRIASLTDQMRLMRTELAAPVFRGSAQARELDERIEEFGRDSVTVGLHALPAGPA
jgi:hypothetical protein